MQINRDRIRSCHTTEIDRYIEARPNTMALFKRARACLPNGVPMSWMAANYPHLPVFVDQARGAWFIDVDGHRYLDMNQADMSMNCGYAPPAVAAAVDRRFRHGSQFLLPTEDAIWVSEELARRFGLTHWQYTLSASTANIEAIRIARVATGRERVLYFDGKYHGHFDDSLVSLVKGELKPEMIGLPSDVAGRGRMVEFNDLEAAESVLRSETIACVMVEPALTNIGVVQPQPGFLAGLRDLAQRHGSILIFDETHTQVCAFGGLTRAFGVTPDIVVLGKCLGGGVAIGAYGMTPGLAQVMEHHLDADGAALESVGGIATGGTLFANALSLAAARATLQTVLTEAAFQQAAELGKTLADGIENVAGRHGLKWRSHRLYCRSGYTFGPDLPRNAREARMASDFELTQCMRTYMANRGVWEALVTAGPTVSFAMNRQDINQYLDVLDRFLIDLLK